MKVSKKGIVSKIKVLKLMPSVLLRFTLECDEGMINCLVSRKNIVDQVLMMPERTEVVFVLGHINKRGQLVIEKLVQTNLSQWDYRKRA